MLNNKAISFQVTVIIIKSQHWYGNVSILIASLSIKTVFQERQFTPQNNRISINKQQPMIVDILFDYLHDIAYCTVIIAGYSEKLLWLYPFIICKIFLKC